MRDQLASRCWRSVVVSVLMALMLIAGSACSPEDRLAAATLEQKIEPFVIRFIVSKAPALGPVPTGVALLGTFLLGEVADNVVEDAEATFLYINQTIDGVESSTVFRIDTKRKLHISMYGKFHQIVEDRKITITPDPTQDSVIRVSDALDGDLALAQGEFSTIVVGGSLAVDFDAGEVVRSDDRDAPEGDGEADYVLRFGALDNYSPLRNGTRIAAWDSGQASMSDCQNMPDDEWHDSLLGAVDNWSLDLSQHFCIQTSEGRLGFLISENLPPKVRFVVWARPGDPGFESLDCGRSDEPGPCS